MNDEQLKQSISSDFCRAVFDFALLNGNLLVPRGSPDNAVSVIPLTIWPSPIPQHLYDAACEAGPLFNTVMDNVSRDYEFLKETFAHITALDDFIGRLWQLYEATWPQKRWSLALSLLRCDYMLHEEADGGLSLRQVEINTIASGFAGLSVRTIGVHAYVLNKLHGSLPPAVAAAFPASGRLPNDPSTLRSFAAIMDLACSTYAAARSADVVALFVVQDKERNRFDQRLMEQAMRHRVVRRTFDQLVDCCTVDPTTGALNVDGLEVALVYYRAGYTPADYTREEHWHVRLMIEQSAAVKCPSIGLQLAGAKKVQQRLFDVDVLKRFLPADVGGEARDQLALQLQRLMMPQVGLDDADQTSGLTAELISAAKNHPERFVLKPQREGGGNNLYGESIRPVLMEHAAAPFVLMQKIMSPAHKNAVLHYHADTGHTLNVADCTSELGIFSCMLADGRRVFANETAGPVLRTKPASVNEGGVSSGQGAIGSPILVD